MTDKEKIRKEVERLRSLHQMKYQQLDTDNSMSLVECGKRNLCNELLSFIDSLQEEPETKFKIGDRIRLKGTTVKGDTIIKIYTSEVGNTYFEFKNSDIASADLDWELIEEPKKCMFTKEEFTEEDRKILCEDCEEECEYAKKEEPVSIWHDASEKPKRDDLLIETNDGRIIHRQSINNYGMVKRWAYTSVLLNLDNLCNLGNNSQEEPVSGLDNGDMPVERWKQAVKAASNQRNYRSSKGLTETRDDYFVDGVQWADENPKEEPVSEDLEEAGKQYLERSNPDRIHQITNAFKAGAQWQKEQDQSTIELAEDHAMLAGMEKMKEEMMKNAVDAVVETDANGLACINVDGVDVGDKVKVIVIKEDKDE